MDFLEFLNKIDKFLDEIYKDRVDENAIRVLDLSNFKQLSKDDEKLVIKYRTILSKLSFKQKIKLFINENLHLLPPQSRAKFNEKHRKSMINLISNLRNDLAHSNEINPIKFQKTLHCLKDFIEILEIYRRNL